MTQLRDNPITPAEAIEYDSLTTHWRWFISLPLVGTKIALWIVKRTVRRYDLYLRNRCHDRS